MENANHKSITMGGGHLLKPYIARVRHLSRENKAAFTLAEVLITLGIIGVVAAMTIPNLITAHQNKVTVTKLQRAISVLNQANRLSSEENGAVSSADVYTMDTYEYYKTYWAPYIKNSQYCTSSNLCGYSSPKPFSFFNDHPLSIWYIDQNLRVAFITPDGFFYSIGLAGWCDGTYTGGKCPDEDTTILVDINGSTGPNRFGKDAFLVQRTQEDSSFVPFGRNLSDTDVNTGCSKLSQGKTCAEKIRRAGWIIDKSYLK